MVVTKSFLYKGISGIVSYKTFSSWTWVEVTFDTTVSMLFLKIKGHRLFVCSSASEPMSQVLVRFMFQHNRPLLIRIYILFFIWFIQIMQFELYMSFDTLWRQKISFQSFSLNLNNSNWASIIVQPFPPTLSLDILKGTKNTKWIPDKTERSKSKRKRKYPEKHHKLWNTTFGGWKYSQSYLLQFLATLELQVLFPWCFFLFLYMHSEKVF